MTWTWDLVAHRGLLVASLAMWLVWCIRRMRGSSGFFPPWSRRLAPWGLLELALAVVVWMAVLVTAHVGLSAWLAVPPETSLLDMTPSIVVPWLLGNGIMLLLATLAGVAAVTWRTGASRIDWLGEPQSTEGSAQRSAMSAQAVAWNLWHDVRAGVGAFVLLAGPVLGLQELLAQSFPTRHPLVELLKASPRLDLLWATGFSAVIVAPLVEELQFRVLLQGWLMRVAESGEPREKWLSASEGVVERKHSPRFWPVLVSATIFALAHWSHGPDPLPLFLFALGLGELYRRSRRLVPVVVAHLSLNAWSMMLLAAEVLRSRSI